MSRPGLVDEVLWNLVCRGDLETAGGGDNLMLGPSIVEIVQATPEGCYLPLDLEHGDTNVS